MTLLDRILERGVPMPMDPIIAARVERHLRRIHPDPLFRRRLRGQVMNRYVATREGMLPPQPVRATRRQMGALGRSVLYASLLTAVGVTAVCAAAQDSLPGDALYGVKLQLEEVRMRIAPPSLRDDLAALALDERLEEVEKLAESGRWQLVEEAAARVEAAEAALARETGGRGIQLAAGQSAGQIEDRIAHIAELLAAAPEDARHGLERALRVTSADVPQGPAEPNGAEPTRPTPSAPEPNAGGGGQPATGIGSDGNDDGAPPADDGQPDTRDGDQGAEQSSKRSSKTPD
jgi:uncharacterized protein DUF5667